MTYVTYTGNARAWRTAAYGGLSAAPGETIDAGSDEAAEWLVNEHEFERTVGPDDDAEEEDSPPTDAAESEPEAPEPLAGTVEELEDALATGEYDEQLVDLYNAEKAHEDRKTAVEAIQDRRDHLREQNTADSEE